MSTTRISIELDADVAQAYAKAPPEEKKKIRMLLSMWLREVARSSPTPLPTLMDEISDRAQAGLFEAISKIQEANPEVDPDQVMKDVLEAQQAVRSLQETK